MVSNREEKRIGTFLHVDRNLVSYYKELGDSSLITALQIFMGLHLLVLKAPNFLSNDKINLSQSLPLFISNLPYFFKLSQPTNLTNKLSH